MNTTPREFRQRFSKYDLQRSQCRECGRFDDYVAESCYHCGSTDLNAIDLTLQGDVITFVVQHYLPKEFDTPLPLGIVETPEGARVLGMFTEVNDSHDVNIGDTVEIVLKKFTRENGQVQYEPKFNIVDEEGDS